MPQTSLSEKLEVLALGFVSAFSSLSQSNFVLTNHIPDPSALMFSLQNPVQGCGDASAVIPPHDAGTF